MGGAPPRPLLLRKMTKNQISLFIFIGAQRTRLFSARHSILLTEEIVFDYSIDSLAQKLVKLESDENNGKMKNFEKFQIYQFFFFFLIFNKFYFFLFVELQYQSSSQKIPTWSRESIGTH